jgi:uncharacterized protein (TIGR02118 family)
VQELQQHWLEVHGPLAAALPGLRRYVQNHVPAEAYAIRGMTLTHDGWSEAWWDDLDALHHARESEAWAKLSDDGQTLFAYPMGVVVARETIQKELSHHHHDRSR